MMGGMTSECAFQPEQARLAFQNCRVNLYATNKRFFMKTPTTASAYRELVDLLARSDPQRVLAFRLSPQAAQRVETLISQEKTNQLSSSEQEELDTYMHLSRIVMLAQAHQLLR